MDRGDRFRVKRILVKPGKRLSLQKHHHRAEHWVVVRGTAEVTRDDVLLLRENESIYLPLGCMHRRSNRGLILVEIVEFQTGPIWRKTTSCGAVQAEFAASSSPGARLS
jgi:mannose-6-phosphate isomerase-like protein (cupin superfamily)